MSAKYKPVHVLSRKSTRQRRNVFIWCTEMSSLELGWRVESDSPITISTAYRWIIDAVLSQSQRHIWLEAEKFTLCPVEIRPSIVLSYSVHKNGEALPRESQDIMPPGDYGVYSAGDATLYLQPGPSFSFEEYAVKMNCPALAAKAALTPSIAQRALDRDRECIFSGAVSSPDGDALVTTYVFPPFLGYELSDDIWLWNRYYQDPDACNLSEFLVAENIISGRKDIITLFWENKLGVDVEDDYRIYVFEGSESLSGPPLKSHLTLSDGPYRPSDRFLRLHFQRCLAVSVCGGNVLRDYGDQEIEGFMDELGVYDNEIDPSDSRWSTPLGVHVNAYLIRQKLAEVEEYASDASNI